MLPVLILEIRKVTKLGRSSLVVSLPKYWVDLAGLKPGDTVTLIAQKDGSVAVYPKEVRTRKVRDVTLTVDPYETEDILIRRIIACYLNGCDLLRVVSTKMLTLSQQQAIREVCGKTDMRIMEAHSKAILLQVFTDVSKVSIERTIQRASFIAASMLQDILKALEERNLELARVVHSLDDDVDQFCLLLLRMIRSATLDLTLANQIDLDPIDSLEYQMLVQNIEHIADQAAFIAKRVIELDRGFLSDPVAEALIAVGYESYRIYNGSVKAFLGKDAVLANQIIDAQGKVGEIGLKLALLLINEKEHKAACIAYRIKESFERIAEYSKDIAKVAIDRAIHVTVPTEEGSSEGQVLVK
jgi:phosphate uptake regulator